MCGTAATRWLLLAVAFVIRAHAQRTCPSIRLTSRRQTESSRSGGPLPAPTPQRELASALFVAPSTLKTHLRAIYRKLGAESRGDAVIRARERGLI